MAVEYILNLFLFYFSIVIGDKCLDTLVDTNMGLVMGLRSDNEEYAMFLGVPYGLVDLEKPFGPAIPHPVFDEPYNAYTDEIVCPQSDGVNAVGDLQCLRMNIYVPNSATTKNKLPVMVWIHGGTFVEGNGNRSNMPPDFLVKKDVIVVTLQYRLGVYGFLCLDTPDIPGNQGLKDQLLGLKWIRENIKAFGGDENRITICGNSAGAISVSLHILTNGEKYFDRAIIQSGPALSPWTVSEANRSIPIDIANSLGYAPEDLEDAMSFLSKENPLAVVNKSFKLLTTNKLGRYHRPITNVCVEKQFEGVNNFLVDYPMNLKSTKVKSMPVIIGITDNELAIYYGVAPKEWYENYSFESMLEYNMEVQPDVVDTLRHYYTGDEVLGDNVSQEITDFASDYISNYPTERMIQQYLNDGAKDIFFYVFSYVGNRNYAKHKLDLQTQGATHADELGYVFKLDMFRNAKEEKDMKMVEVITTLWTNFVKHGNPTPELSDLIPFKWIPVTESTRPYLNLNSELELKNRPYKDRLAFWNLFYKVNLKNLKDYKYRKTVSTRVVADAGFCEVNRCL